MENKKNKNVLYIILALSFLCFITLYIMQNNGYYEYNNYQKTTLTEEAIKKFEKDVASGKDIKVEDYLENTYKDYSNSTSNLGLKTGELIENFMNKGLKQAFKVFSALFFD